MKLAKIRWSCQREFVMDLSLSLSLSLSLFLSVEKLEFGEDLISSLSWLWMALFVLLCFLFLFLHLDTNCDIFVSFSFWFFFIWILQFRLYFSLNKIFTKKKNLLTPKPNFHNFYKHIFRSSVFFIFYIFFLMVKLMRWVTEP